MLRLSKNEVPGCVSRFRRGRGVEAITRADKLHVEFKKIGDAEMKAVVERHARYVASKKGGARASLKFHDLSYTDLHGTNLAGVDFTGSRLTEADFTEADIRGALLFGADLRKAKFARANLAKADLRGAALQGADMPQANLSEADLRDGYLIRQQDGELKSTAPEDAHSQLSNALLTGANLSKAKLANAFLIQTDLRDTNLSGCVFIGADLSNSDLTGSNLEGADLSDANLSGCKLTGAILDKHFGSTVFDQESDGRQGALLGWAEVSNEPHVGACWGTLSS